MPGLRIQLFKHTSRLGYLYPPR